MYIGDATCKKETLYAYWKSYICIQEMLYYVYRRSSTYKEHDICI